MTPDQKREYYLATKCSICEKVIDDTQEKVADHCHLRDEFHRAAHQVCNLNY